MRAKTAGDARRVTSPGDASSTGTLGGGEEGGVGRVGRCRSIEVGGASSSERTDEATADGGRRVGPGRDAPDVREAFEEVLRGVVRRGRHRARAAAARDALYRRNDPV